MVNWSSKKSNMDEERLRKMEEQMSSIRENHSAIRENLSMITKTLETLADLRSETLHIIKQQEQDKQDRDEIFTRLRVVESRQATYIANGKSFSKRVDKLEVNQRWGVIAILASIIAFVSKKLFIS